MKFSERGPAAYRFACACFRARRALWRLFSCRRWARKRTSEDLPFLVKDHATPLIRALHGVDPVLQRNKVRNLGLAVARVDGILVRPGEEFSFWLLAGPNTRARGYLPGLVLKHGSTGEDYGGGICQLANMIHWLVLHSELEITERHHHSSDFFPDNLRRVPFGSGASVFHNYVDYRFRNRSSTTYQLRLRVTETRLEGELRAEREPPLRYEVHEPFHRFVRWRDEYWRENVVARRARRREDGEEVEDRELYHHFSKVLYDPSFIPSFEDIETEPDLSLKPRPPVG